MFITINGTNILITNLIVDSFPKPIKCDMMKRTSVVWQRCRMPVPGGCCRQVYLQRKTGGEERRKPEREGRAQE